MHDKKKVLKVLLVLIGTNALFFWLPFIVHNRIAYGRSIVSNGGAALLIGLMKNPNEHHGERHCKIIQSVAKEHGIKGISSSYLSPEYMDAATKTFWKMFKQRPKLYFDRLWGDVRLFFSPSFLSENIFEQHFFRFPILDMFYLYFFVVAGFLGLALFCFRRKFLALMIVLGVLFSSWNMIFSHFEPRYLSLFYWIMAIPAGYLLNEVFAFIRKYFNKISCMLGK